MEKKTGRLLSLILAAALSLTLAACGDEKNQEESSEESSVAATQADKEEPEEEKPEEPEEEPADSEPTPEEEAPAAEGKSAAEIIDEVAVGEVKSAALKEVGKLEGDDVEHYGEFLYKSISDDEIRCLDYTGKELLDGKVVYVEKLNGMDLYVYYTEAEGDMSYCGLMDAEGNVVLGTDAKVGTFEEVDGRFIKAYLPEAVTESRDDAIYYATNRQFSIDVGDDDVMYSGTVKLYDTKENKFLESSAAKYDPNYRVGDELIFFYDDDYNTIAFTADDKSVDVGDKTVVGDFITEYTDGRTVVYDKDMKKLFDIEYTISELAGTHDFYAIYDSESGLRGIMHKSGTVMVEPKYNSVTYVADGVFSYNYDDYSKQGLFYVDGTEITKDDYKYVSATGIPGFYSVCTQDGKYQPIDMEGNVLVDDQEYGFTEGSYIKSSDSDEYAYFVVGKKDASLKLKYSGSYLGNQLLDGGSNNAIYDLVTGEALMEGFDKSYEAYGYVYIVKDGETTIYKVEKAAE